MVNKGLSSLFLGFIFIFLGIVFLLDNFFTDFNIDWSLIWPGFILIPGLMFWFIWITSSDKEKNAGILVPANILVFLSATFFFNMLISEFLDYSAIWAWTIFMYPASIGLGLWIAWLGSGKNDTKYKVGSIFFSIISFLLFILMSCVMIFVTLFDSQTAKIIWPLIFITLGAFMVFSTVVFNTTGNKRMFGRSKEDWQKWGEGFGRKVESFVKTVEKSIDNATNSEKKENE